MSSLNRMFRAFADETRLRIIHLLTRDELCVCDIMKVISAPQPKISRHLAYLKRAGLVTDRKEGSWRYYSLAKPASAFQKRLVECVGRCLDEAPVLKRDAARLLNRSRKGCQ